MELAQIMRDLSTLVVEQGTLLDRIDHNITEAAIKVRENPTSTRAWGRLGCAQHQQLRGARRTAHQQSEGSETAMAACCDQTHRLRAAPFLSKSRRSQQTGGGPHLNTRAGGGGSQGAGQGGEDAKVGSRLDMHRRAVRADCAVPHHHHRAPRLAAARAAAQPAQQPERACSGCFEEGPRAVMRQCAL